MAWSPDREAAEGLGVVSLISAVFAPFLFFFLAGQALPYDTVVWPRALLIFVAPVGAVVAIVTGAMSRRSADRPMIGRVGFVIGIVELVVLLLLALLILGFHDAMMESI